jgi:hypothetical protein
MLRFGRFRTGERVTLRRQSTTAANQVLKLFKKAIDQLDSDTLMPRRESLSGRRIGRAL